MQEFSELRKQFEAVKKDLDEQKFELEISNDTIAELQKQIQRSRSETSTSGEDLTLMNNLSDTSNTEYQELWEQYQLLKDELSRREELNKRNEVSNFLFLFSTLFLFFIFV